MGEREEEGGKREGGGKGARLSSSHSFFQGHNPRLDSTLTFCFFISSQRALPPLAVQRAGRYPFTVRSIRQPIKLETSNEVKNPFVFPRSRSKKKKKVSTPSNFRLPRGVTIRFQWLFHEGALKGIITPSNPFIRHRYSRVTRTLGESKPSDKDDKKQRTRTFDSSHVAILASGVGG